MAPSGEEAGSRWGQLQQCDYVPTEEGGRNMSRGRPQRIRIWSKASRTDRDAARQHCVGPTREYSLALHCGGRPRHLNNSLFL